MCRNEKKSICLSVFTLFISCNQKTNSNLSIIRISSEDSLFLLLFQKHAQAYAFSSPDFAIFMHNKRNSSIKNYLTSLKVYPSIIGSDYFF